MNQLIIYFYVTQQRQNGVMRREGNETQKKEKEKIEEPWGRLSRGENTVKLLDLISGLRRRRLFPFLKWRDLSFGLSIVTKSHRLWTILERSEYRERKFQRFRSENLKNRYDGTYYTK